MRKLVPLFSPSSSGYSTVQSVNVHPGYSFSKNARSSGFLSIVSTFPLLIALSLTIATGFSRFLLADHMRSPFDCRAIYNTFPVTPYSFGCSRSVWQYPQCHVFSISSRSRPPFIIMWTCSLFLFPISSQSDMTYMYFSSLRSFFFLSLRILAI